MKKHKVSINGQSWTYSLLSQKDYENKHGTDSRAITLLDLKHIDFQEDSTDYITITHELIHAFKYYIHLENSESISEGDYEEIYATFFSKMGPYIMLSANKIYIKLNKLEEKNLKEYISLTKELNKLCKKL